MRSLRTFLVLGLLSLVAASGCLGSNVSTHSSSVTCIQDDCEVCVGDGGDCVECEEDECEECRDGDCAAFDAAPSRPVPGAAAADFSERGSKDLTLSAGSWSLEVDVAEGATSSHAHLAIQGHQGLRAENGQHCFEYSFAGPSGSSDWSTGSCGSVGNVNVAVVVIPTGRDIGLFDESELAVGHHTFKVTWEPRQANTLVWDVAVDY